MKIICTGITGFIGEGLVPALREKGHALVLLSRRRRTRRPGDAAAGDIRMVSWNGRDEGPWMEEIEGADAVINFAGEPLNGKRWTPEQKKRIVDSRVNATRAVVRAIASAAQKPRVLVNASGVGYYGDTGDTLVTEAAASGTDLLARTCAQWEEAARVAEQHGVRTVILRQAVVLGEEGGALRTMTLPFKFFAGGPLGPGDQWFPWVHRADLVSIILRALDNPSYSGPINVAAPEAVTNRQFCEALGRVLGRPCWLPVPAWSLRLALGEMASMVLTGQRVIPARLKGLGFSFQYPRLLPALRDILD